MATHLSPTEPTDNAVTSEFVDRPINWNQNHCSGTMQRLSNALFARLLSHGLLPDFVVRDKYRLFAEKAANAKIKRTLTEI